MRNKPQITMTISSHTLDELRAFLGKDGNLSAYLEQAAKRQLWVDKAARDRGEVRQPSEYSPYR
jgi:hypothetical protein